MAILKSFREIAIANSTKQPDMVDQVLEGNPILDMIPMQPASHGLWNLYEEQGTVTGAGLVDFDSELCAPMMRIFISLFSRCFCDFLSFSYHSLIG